MGIFDYVDFTCSCPSCDSKVQGFQSKDGPCTLDTLHPNRVNTFYGDCRECGLWLTFTRCTEDELTPEEHVEKYFKKELG